MSPRATKGPGRKPKATARPAARLSAQQRREEKPCERLMRLRIAAGFPTAVSAAEAMGTNITSYLHHEAGRRMLTRKVAEKYAEFFHVAAGFILYGEALKEHMTVPILGVIGPGGHITMAAKGAESMSIQAPKPATESLGSYRVVSADLWPAYSQGDVAFFDTVAYSQPLDLPMLDGRECVVLTADGRHLLRFVTAQENGTATLMPYAGSPELDVRLVRGARVLWVQRRA